MTAFFLSAAGFCTVYFVVLCVYARQLVAQSWIWLFFALVCLGNVLFRWLHARTPGKVSLFLLTQLHTLSFLGMAVLMASGLVLASGMHPKAKGQPEYAIVLGAGLKPDGSLSKTLKQRLDTALDFAAKSPETRFILSGGYDRRGQRTEAEVMAEYLMKQGLPKQRLLLEVQSKNTYENMIYSYALLHRVNNEDYPVFYRGGRALGAAHDPGSGCCGRDQLGFSSIPGFGHTRGAVRHPGARGPRAECRVLFCTIWRARASRS